MGVITGEGYLFRYVLQSEQIVLHSTCVIPVYKTQLHLLLEVPVGFDVSRFRKLHLHFGKERMGTTSAHVSPDPDKPPGAGRPSEGAR